MNWEDYCFEFRNHAKRAGKSEQYCVKYLEYAEKLYRQGLPIIYNQDHFCELVGYKAIYLYAASNSPEHFYRVYKIPKKSGGYREISEPMPSLKEIQHWILDNILVNIEVSAYAKAYVKGKSIKENARFHKGQKLLLSLDIEKFFDNISGDKVYNVFRNLGYAKDVAVMLTNLCCLNGGLPQGAPTSPALSNIIMREFDDTIGIYTKERKIRYTRYADDMTFSGDFSSGQIISFVKKNLNLLGLRLNKDKTRTRNPGQRQEVTGIVVNKKLQLSKEVRKRIRQEMYYIKKYGIESHQQYSEINQANYLLHLKGVIQHGLFVNPKDLELQSYLDFLTEKYYKY